MSPYCACDRALTRTPSRSWREGEGTAASVQAVGGMWAACRLALVAGEARGSPRGTPPGSLSSLQDDPCLTVRKLATNQLSTPAWTLTTWPLPRASRASQGLCPPPVTWARSSCGGGRCTCAVDLCPWPARAQLFAPAPCRRALADGAPRARMSRKTGQRGKLPALMFVTPSPARWSRRRPALQDVAFSVRRLRGGGGPPEASCRCPQGTRVRLL